MRLFKETTMNARDEWLEQRKKGVGGSDAAAALGQSRYKTAYQLFLEKTDALDADVMFGSDVIERMEFGQALEQVIADQYAKRFDVRLRRHNKPAQHPRFKWMLSSYDRTVDGRKEGLECKNVDAMSFRLGEWGPEHSDEIPPEYLLQCHHYLTTSNYDVWHLAACIGGNRLAVYHVERDREMSEMLIEGEHDFWKRVENNEAPPMDYRATSAIPLLKRLFPGSNGNTISLPAEAEALHYARLDFEEQAKTFEAGALAARARLMHLMGEASIGLLPNGGAYRRKLVERKGYSVDATRYVDFRFSKKGAGDE
jgi:putative phage-type endonuclease